MKTMTNTMQTIDDFIDQCFSGEVAWVHDQLDGTSFIKDDLDNIEKEKAQTKQTLSTMISEIIGEDIEESDYTLNMFAKHNPPSNTTRTNLSRQGANSLRVEQRQRATDRGFTL